MESVRCWKRTVSAPKMRLVVEPVSPKQAAILPVDGWGNVGQISAGPDIRPATGPGIPKLARSSNKWMKRTSARTKVMVMRRCVCWLPPLILDVGRAQRRVVSQDKEWSVWL